MLAKHDIEKQRSPRGLSQFVVRRVRKIRQISDERHKAMLKKGIYKIFSDEVSPLSIFCLQQYPNNYTIQPIIGNQGYDAIVRNEQQRVVDYIELTLPHDGASAAKDARLVVSRGYGKTDVYDIGENLTRMFSLILEVCQKKSHIDYTDCTLVVILNFVPPFPEHKKLYIERIKQLIEEIRGISFRSKRVYLLVVPFKQVLTVFCYG